jgi:hypothetical protein
MYRMGGAAGDCRLSCAVFVAMLTTGAAALAQGPPESERSLVGWGWRERPHGQTLASDVLGQFVDGDPSRPNFGGYGPYGGPTPHGFFFFAFNAGRYQVAGTPAAHLGARLLAVPDYWNHRVLLFDLREDGAPAARGARRLIGQQRFDEMEIGQGPSRLHYPSACAFDPSGRFLFVADEYNHRVLQFDLRAPQQAVRVYGQRNFDDWGYDATPGDLVWDSTRDDVRGPKIVRRTSARGLFLPRGVACDGRRLFVSDTDNHRVLVFNIAGTENGPEAFAVLGQRDFSGHDPNQGEQRPTLATMCFPAGLALDPSQKWLLVADSANLRVLVFDVSERITSGAAAAASVNLPRIDESDLPNPPYERRLSGALSVAVDDEGQVFVADRDQRRVVVYQLADLLVGRS